MLHESYAINGEILNAGGGSVSRVVMMKSRGIASRVLSLEEVAARIDEIMDVSQAVPAPLTIPNLYSAAHGA